MATTKKANRQSTAASDAQVIVGIKQDLTSVTSIPLNGATYTPTSLAAFIQSRIDATNAVLNAKANWQDATKTLKALNTTATAVVRGLRSFVIGMFGPTSPKLADFGFTPTTRTPLTPQQKATAAAKRLATRAARHTLGPKQKKGITGATAAQAAAPATAGATPTTTPTPNPAATASTTAAPAQNGAAPTGSAAPATAPAKS